MAKREDEALAVTRAGGVVGLPTGPMQESDRAARTEDVWRRFSARLRAFLRSRLSDDSAAEDVLQDVFIKVHARIHTLRDDDRIQSWLYQIARNAIVDHFRGRVASVAIEDLSAAEAVAAEPPSREAEQKLAAALLEMISGLPPHYRDAIMLTEIDGITQAEMAERLEVSLSAGKSRVQRGREKLKELLLDCCHVELDRHGTVIAYQSRYCCDAARPPRTGKKRTH